MFWNKMTKIRNAMKVAFRVFVFIVIILSLLYLIQIGMEYGMGVKEYQALQENVMKSEISIEEEESAETKKRMETDKSLEEKWKTEKILEKVKALKQKNADTVGWIAFDTVDISYPIMQGEDNGYYLNHTFSGKENKAGSIFMEAGNASDFTDYHTILYGHNMKNGSMFGKLKKYREETFFEENPYFSVYTEDKRYRYEIFSIQITAADSRVYTIGFSPNAEYQSFLEDLVKNSWYERGKVLAVTDQVITLSTCVQSDEKRLVIHAKRIKT